MGSKLPIPSLLSSAKLCFCLLFQGDPRSSGIDLVFSECTPVSPILAQWVASQQRQAFIYQASDFGCMDDNLINT